MTRHWPQPRPAPPMWLQPRPMKRRRSRQCNRRRADSRRLKQTIAPQKPARNKCLQPTPASCCRGGCPAKARALEQAELNLQYTKIVAPVSGQVNKTVVVGLNVQPGQQLLTVVPLDEVWITANFKETQLRHMKVGQKAEIYVDSTGTTLRGHVDSIAGATGPTIQFASAGECHRKLRENCPACSGKDRS